MRGSTRALGTRIDSHLHVWSPKEEAETFPYYGALIGSDAKANEPPMPGYAELLLEQMKSAGVSQAVIVQPGNHMFDHKYVSHVLQRYPKEFVGVLLANPAEGAGAGALELERLVREGYSGVRFNPYLWPEGEQMTNSVGRAMYEKAGQLGVPVSHMPFKGLLNHIDEIKTLADTFPSTKFIVDHYGFCKCDDLESDEWKALLDLAKYPQAYVKLSASFRVSRKPYPHVDVRKAIRNLIEAFGASRLMWGSDFPWITEEEGGYLGAWNIIQDGNEACGGQKLLSSEEEEWIYSKTACELFPKLNLNNN
ncbi:catalytic hydrolase [Chloropicon primus]|uniref:Catalytic hydrolase n=1 Tax=Chloropicon primus TaxID=1764295 RepID=A0A5B8MSC2_9CHLO|nr:catalytic hydrolase [Chloropicon primus]UPR02578.1 catalytic hydrolase [Chloropicon primus]|eukprot:QDZ23366.1 catalytic hydrolase [Chloropicon primus]